VKLTSKQALLLRAFSGWTIYVWVTRMWNIWRDEARDLPFKAVHSVLALVSVGLAVAALVVVQRNRRTPDVAAPREPDRVSA
jgi:TRAP-type C4-dicarboxylate transport system permease small subunit